MNSTRWAAAPTDVTRPAPLAGAGRVAGAAALIAVLTVLSRLAGFGRTAVFTWVVQDSDLGAMYVIANTLPNIVFEIVAGGALASLVVPLLAGPVATGDRRAVTATTGALLTWTVTLLVPLAVLLALGAGPAIALIGDDRSPEELAAGARMLRVFAPQLPLYGIGIVLTGVLQAHRRFAWPVIAPLLSSLTVIVAYLGFAGVAGTGASVAQAGRGAELILSAGTTAGVVVLSLSLLIPLRRLRLTLRPGYAFPADARARVGGLAVAGVVTVTAQQVALLVMLNRLSAGPTEAPQVFNLALTFYLLPWAVLAVPLATAAYPTLAAARGERRRPDLPGHPVGGPAWGAAVQFPRRGGAGRRGRTDRTVLPAQRRRHRRRRRRVRARPARVRAVRGALPRPVRPGGDPGGHRRHQRRLAGGAAGHAAAGGRCSRWPTGCSPWRWPTRWGCCCSAGCCWSRCCGWPGGRRSTARPGPVPPVCWPARRRPSPRWRCCGCCLSGTAPRRGGWRWCRACCPESWWASCSSAWSGWSTGGTCNRCWPGCGGACVGVRQQGGDTRRGRGSDGPEREA